MTLEIWTTILKEYSKKNVPQIPFYKFYYISLIST